MSAAPITAEDFSKSTHAVKFGLDVGTTAQALTRFATNVLDGEFLIQEVSICSKAQPDDYVYHTLEIRYCVAKRPAKLEPLSSEET